MNTTKISSDNDKDVVDFLRFNYDTDKKTIFCIRTPSVNWFKGNRASTYKDLEEMRQSAPGSSFAVVVIIYRRAIIIKFDL